MADPLLTVGGAQTVQQYAHMMATSWMIAYGNGNGSAFTSPLFANTYWASIGMDPLPESAWGVTKDNPNNVVDPMVYQKLYRFAMHLMKNPDAAAQGGIQVPRDLRDDPAALTPDEAANRDFANNDREDRQAHDAGQAQLDRDFTAGENEKNRLQQMAIANLQEAGMNARQAAELANRLTITQLQEAAANTRNAERIAADERIAAQQDATQRYGIDVNAAVNREDIAARERIAGLDRTSRENIATADRQESARQFDLGLAEDRRQFNADLLMRGLEMGAQLAAKPVDWIAHQYWMNNLGIPLAMINFQTVAGLVGAIPPTGASSVGPVTGGPGAMDGDTQLAQTLGVQAGFVSIQQALAENPGDPSGVAQGITAAETGQKFAAQMGGFEALEKGMAMERLGAFEELGQNQMTELAKREAMGLATPDGLRQFDSAGQQKSFDQSAVRNLIGQRGAFGAKTLDQPQDQPAQPAQPGNSGVFAGRGSADQIVAQQNAIGGAGAQQNAGAAGGNTADEYIKQLAAQLGIDEEQLRKALGTQFMAGGYSAEQIANSPVIQALVQGKDKLSAFRTESTEGTPFGKIQAFGIDLGMRGGHDVNAGLLLKGNESSRQMLQGAIEATGQYFPDVMQQSFRTAPIGQWDKGAFGRRRF